MRRGLFCECRDVPLIGMASSGLDCDLQQGALDFFGQAREPAAVTNDRFVVR